MRSAYMVILRTPVAAVTVVAAAAGGAAATLPPAPSRSAAAGLAATTPAPASRARLESGLGAVSVVGSGIEGGLLPGVRGRPGGPWRARTGGTAVAAPRAGALGRAEAPRGGAGGL